MTKKLVFLDTSTLITLLGCREEAETITQLIKTIDGKPVIHQAHYTEAAKRLAEAVIEIINTGRNGGKCLTNLAKQILDKHPRPTTLRSISKAKITARQQAQRLLQKLIHQQGIQVLYDDKTPGKTRCPDLQLSPQDTILVDLATECHTIMSSDNNLIKCCKRETSPEKCLKTPQPTTNT